MSGATAVAGVVDDDRLFDVESAAELLAIKPATLRRWIRERRIDAYNIGGEGRGAEWRISGAAINAFLERAFQPATEDDEPEDA